MMTRERRLFWARTILNDIRNIDPAHDAHLLEAIGNRVGAATLDPDLGAATKHPAIDPRMRAEVLQIFCTLAGALGRTPDAYHEIKSWDAVALLALEAHVSLCKMIDEAGR